MMIIVVDSLHRSHRALLELRSYHQPDPEGANLLLASAVVLVNIYCAFTVSSLLLLSASFRRCIPGPKH